MPLPHNWNISLGEELPCHLDELKQHRTPTVLLTPAKNKYIQQQLLQTNLAFVSANCQMSAVSGQIFIVSQVRHGIHVCK